MRKFDGLFNSGKKRTDTAHNESRMCPIWRS